MKIEIPFTESIDAILKYGTEQSKSFKGKFEGDNKQGIFNLHSPAGIFQGSYIVRNNLIEIQFDKKPFFIPAAIIKKFLKKHIR